LTIQEKVKKVMKKVDMSLTEKSLNFKNQDTFMRRAVNVMFTQMSANKGMKMFGERAVAAMF